MNAMGSNSSILNLFMSLGQNLDAPASELTSGDSGNGSFATLLADLGLSEDDLAGLLADGDLASAGLSELQNLPPDDQHLPPSLPLAGAAVNLTDPAVADDQLRSVLEQIAQGKKPIPVSSLSPAETDTDDLAQGGLMTDIEALQITPPTDESDTDASGAVLAAAVVAAPAAATPARSADANKSAGMDKSRSAADSSANMMAADSADTETDQDSGLDPDAEIFTPVTEKSSRETAQLNPLNVTQTSAPNAQHVNNTTAVTADPAQTAALAVASSPADTSDSEAAELFTTSDQEVNNDQLLKTERTLARERMEFGSDGNKWGAALGSRIVTMVAEGIQEARIQLDPPELGSMELKLQVHQDQTSVQVQVQNNQVRDVLEANAQRLRDALAQQGMTLSGFDVSTQSGSSQQQSGQPGSDGNDQYGSDGVLTTDDESSLQEPRGVVSAVNSLLDTFA